MLLVIHYLCFVVIRNGQCCILYKNTALDHDLIRYNIVAIFMKDYIRNKMYPNLFRDEIGKCIDYKLKIDVDESVPEQDKFIHIPYNI